MNEVQKKGNSKAGIIILLLLLGISVAGNIWQFLNNRQVIVASEKIVMERDTLNASRVVLESVVINL